MDCTADPPVRQGLVVGVAIKNCIELSLLLWVCFRCMQAAFCHQIARDIKILPYFKSLRTATKEQAKQNMSTFLAHTEMLGLTLNSEKSSPKLKQAKLFSYMKLDSLWMCGRHYCIASDSDRLLWLLLSMIGLLIVDAALTCQNFSEKSRNGPEISERDILIGLHEISCPLEKDHNCRHLLWGWSGDKGKISTDRHACISSRQYVLCTYTHWTL